MKKSCSGKESKVVTTNDSEHLLKDSKEDSKDHLTEEQLYINKQLSESGIDCEGLGWLEKRNIVRTINVSLDCAGSERLHRNSPRLANSSHLRAKWVENSFENTNRDDCNNEKNSKNKFSKKDPKLTSTPVRKSISCTNKKPTPESEDLELKSNKRKDVSECSENSQNDVGTLGESPKSSKKVHYIKIHIEGETKEEGPVVKEEDSQGVSVGKKRASHPEETELVDAPKKLKMEESNNRMSPVEEENPLSIEIELEKRKRNAPFVLRDIKVIVTECEVRNKKWKETFSRYKCPTRWGNPIVRNCNEKWDGKQIPQKLLHRFQKYLSSNNLYHPVFLPINSDAGVDVNKLSGEMSCQSSTCTNSECRDDTENDFKDLGDGSFVEDGEMKTTTTLTPAENNLNASTSSSDASGRMVLRNRNQQKPIVLDEDEEYSSDDSDEWFSKQKPNKKQKINSKIKKAADLNNKQLVLKLERCNINKKNGNDSNRKNGNKNDVSFTGGSLLINNGIGNSKTVPDPDTMVCPICSVRFKKQLIESHATECASKTYKD